MGSRRALAVAHGWLLIADLPWTTSLYSVARTRRTHHRHLDMERIDSGS